MPIPQGSFTLPTAPPTDAAPTTPTGVMLDTDRESAESQAAFQNLCNHPNLAEWARSLFQNLIELHGGVAARALTASLGMGNITLPDYLLRGRRKAQWLIHFLTSPEIDSTVQRAFLEEGFLQSDPAWLQELIRKEQSQVARCFLLTGNVSDYAYDPVAGYRPGISLLSDVLCDKKDGVLLLSLSQGLRFIARDMQVEERLPAMIQEILKQRRFDPAQPLIGQVCTLFDQLRTWLEAETEWTRGIAIIVENIQFLVAPEVGGLERNFLIDSLLSWSVSTRLFHEPHCLILMADSLEEVYNELQAHGGKIEQIAIERPSNAKVRLKFLLPLLQPRAELLETRAARQRTGLEMSGYVGDALTQTRILAHDTAGLTLMGIEDILQQAIFASGRVLERGAVMTAKQERLRQESEGLLEIIQPRRTLTDLGGYPALKQRLLEVIRALHNASNPLICSTIPMGILLLGPPGTGKTVAAEAIAGESGIAMAKLGDFRGMYVGQSERNLSRLLSLIESLHPVIVFIDELDQSEGSRGDNGDSNVSKRVFSKLLQFMSDTSHRGKVLWIGASNRPDLIDAAMKRAGRFDLALPFVLPDLHSRADIFRLLLRSRLSQVAESDVTIELSEEDYQALAEATDGFSGAEIEAVLGEMLRRTAQEIALTGKQVRIGRATIESVLRVYVPPQVRDHYSAMEDLALKEINSLDLLPPDLQVRREQLGRQ